MSTKQELSRPALKAVTSQPDGVEIDTVDRPSFKVFDTLTKVEGRNRRAGVWRFAFNIKTGEPVDTWVCEPLHIIAEAVSRQDKSHYLVLRFSVRNEYGSVENIEWVMPKSYLAGQGAPLIEDLFKQGLNINTDHQKSVHQYVAQFARPSEVFSLASAPGWHDQQCFVLPKKTIGKGSVRYQQSLGAATLFSVKGDLKQFKSLVASYCTGNPTLILAICIALAGPLLAKIGIHGGGFHMVGDSSTGKTLVLLICAAIWGKPEAFAASWDVSKGGVEIEAASRNDTVLVLDEISRANPRSIQEMTYMLANGGGKGTMTRDREGREKLRWRILTLSSGEKTLAEHAALSGDPANAGAELRMVDVNAGERTYRAFDHLHGMTGETLHRKLSTAITEQYGTAGPAFVERLIEDLDSRDLIEEFAGYRSGMVTDNAQAGRVADRFALAAMAGELATEYGVLPWEPGTASDACTLLFQEWLKRVGSGNSEDRKIIRALSDYIDTYGESRFADISFNVTSNGGSNLLHGYYQIHEGSRTYMFTTSGLEAAAPGFGAQRICLALKQAEALLTTEKGRYQKAVRLRDGRIKRLYAISEDKVQAATKEQ